MRYMRVLEAKDFLVQQTEEQAILEGTPLSDLEKRMMYFTEIGKCPEDPIALNREFEAKYDTAAYEKKIYLLMGNAYSRIKNEEQENLRQWDNAIQVLSRGDHYILVLWGRSTGRTALHHWRLFVLILAPAVALLLVALLFSPSRYSASFLSRYLPAPNPAVEHVFQILFFTLLIAGFLFPKALARLAALCFEPLFKWADNPEKEDDSQM